MGFNRERFLLWTLAGLLAWQAAIFTFGTWSCIHLGEKKIDKGVGSISDVCPEIGNRYEKFVNVSLSAVLGLLAGSAAVGAAVSRQKKQVEVRDDPRNPRDPDSKP